MGYMPGAGSNKPPPESGATPYGRTNSTVTSRTSTAGAPPGGYVHNGAIFDAMDRLVGYTSSGGGGAPSSWDDTADSIYGPGGQQASRTNATATSRTEPIRIGKGRQDRRTNAPTVRDRYPKPKARDTTQSRMAQENANAAWQRTRANQHAAGVDTAEYGRALAMSRFLRESGITPLSTQQAARRAASGPYGV
jgi:hypothetical protein